MKYTPAYTPAYPWALVRNDRIVGYAWTRKQAQDTIDNPACAREWRGAKVYPNPIARRTNWEAQ
jgi:hypothetical protein